MCRQKDSPGNVSALNVLLLGMIGHLPPHAVAFTALFARVEHALRRNGYVRSDQKRAVVNWRNFAKELGDEFFESVRQSKLAMTLIAEPPRVYHRNQGFLPNVQEPITDVVQLFGRGVCQVRNNIVHGEKYVDLATPRDDALVQEANYVLEQALSRHPRFRNFANKLQIAK
jgi:hypothetical protein